MGLARLQSANDRARIHCRTAAAIYEQLRMHDALHRLHAMCRVAAAAAVAGGACSAARESHVMPSYQERRLQQEAPGQC